MDTRSSGNPQSRRDTNHLSGHYPPRQMRGQRWLLDLMNDKGCLAQRRRISSLGLQFFSSSAGVFVFMETKCNNYERTPSVSFPSGPLPRFWRFMRHRYWKFCNHARMTLRCPHLLRLGQPVAFCGELPRVGSCGKYCGRLF